MKKLLTALFAAALLILTTPSTASAAEGCVINVAGIKVCGELLGPLPTVTVHPDPIRIPGPTVTLPPNTVPGPTIKVPGPTVTVTAPPAPGSTSTVTATPAPVGPSSLPTPTGQPSPTRGTVTPSQQPEQNTSPDDTRTKTETIVRYVTLGTLLTLALVALGILGLFLGYAMGQKDAQRNEDDFLKSLLSYVRGGKRPDIK